MHSRVGAAVKGTYGEPASVAMARWYFGVSEPARETRGTIPSSIVGREGLRSSHSSR